VTKCCNLQINFEADS